MGLADDYARFCRAHTPKPVTIHGRTWSVLDRGAGPALLLIHGTIGDPTIFFRLFEQLTGVRLVALGMPLVDDATVLGRDIGTLAAMLGIERFNLLGTSVGSYVAQFAAAHLPNLDHLILSAPMVETHTLPIPSSRALWLLEHLPTPLFRHVIRRGMTRWPTSPPIQAEAMALLKSVFLRDSPGRRMASRVRIMARHREAPIAPLPASRILVIQSHDDPLIPESTRTKVQQRYPDACRAEFDWGGHFLYLTCPQAFAEAVQTQLRLSKRLSQ